MVVQHNMQAANANRQLGITTSLQVSPQRSFLRAIASTVQATTQQG